jgi:hypothetical protein
MKAKDVAIVAFFGFMFSMMCDFVPLAYLCVLIIGVAFYIEIQ